MLTAAETRKLKGRSTRGGRFVAPLVFCAALLTVNLGLHGLLAPETRLSTELPFALNGLDDWTPVTGAWQWQDGVLIQDNEVLGLVVAPLRLTDAPTRLHLKLTPNSGLSFAMRSARTLEASHVLFLYDTYLTSGYIDAEGYFETQFTLPVDPANTGEELGVSVLTEGDSYSILVDHALVASDLPLYRVAGALGLLSERKTQVQGLLVDADTARQAGSVEAPDPSLYQQEFNLGLARDPATLTGNWNLENGRLLQSQPSGVDHALLFPDLLTPSSVELTFNHLAGTGGGGLVLNAPSLTELAGAHIVRLSEGEGQMYALWGYFDARRNFVSQGSAPLSEFDMSEQRATLGVDINGASFDISVNGERLAEDVFLYSLQGYTGLTASEREVAFDSLRITTRLANGAKVW